MEKKTCCQSLEQLDFLVGPQCCRGHWEEWECQDKDYQ